MREAGQEDESGLQCYQLGMKRMERRKYRRIIMKERRKCGNSLEVLKDSRSGL